MKRSGARFKPIGHKSKDYEKSKEDERHQRSEGHRRHHDRSISGSADRCAKDVEKSDRKRKAEEREDDRTREKHHRRDSEGSGRRFNDPDSAAADDDGRIESRRHRKESRHETKSDRSPGPSSSRGSKRRRRSSEEHRLLTGRDPKRRLSGEGFEDAVAAKHRREKVRGSGDSRHKHFKDDDKGSRHRRDREDYFNDHGPSVGGGQRRSPSDSFKRERSGSRDFVNEDFFESRLVTYQPDDRDFSPVSDEQGDRWSDEEKFYSRIRSSSAASERAEAKSNFREHSSSRTERKVRHLEEDDRRHGSDRGSDVKHHKHDRGYNGEKSDHRSSGRDLQESPTTSSKCSNGQKLDFTEFLDRAYSDRPRPEARDSGRSSKRSRDHREKRRFNDRSVHKDRWESNSDRGVQHIKNNFVSGGTQRF